MEKIKYYEINIDNYNNETNKVKIDRIKEIIENATIVLNDKKYLRAWALVTLANCDRLLLDVSDIKFYKDGNIIVQCKVYDYSLKENHIISSQYGSASIFENGENKDIFVAMGMAQTRATARALKQLYSFLINYVFKLEYSILEEMPVNLKNENLEKQNNYNNHNYNNNIQGYNNHNHVNTFSKNSQTLNKIVEYGKELETIYEQYKNNAVMIEKIQASLNNASSLIDLLKIKDTSKELKEFIARHYESFPAMKKVSDKQKEYIKLLLKSSKV